jgi:hypothetical protein
MFVLDAGFDYDIPRFKQGSLFPAEKSYDRTSMGMSTRR